MKGSQLMRREWELEDLIERWTLDEAKAQLLGNKSGTTRLGFALTLKFFEQEARFPRREDVPKPAVDYLAGQIKVDPALFAAYEFTSRQASNHRAQRSASWSGSRRSACRRCCSRGPRRR
ncbi:DUF4158 domain-containing protein [Nonomuraea wenchangensis]|uniref:DUF4158 domain-containing protein n=1 Tax=Nonomuraea wenchangensis TaxID=568860 RepID=UPI0034421113